MTIFVMKKLALVSVLAVLSASLFAEERILTEATHAHVIEFFETVLKPGYGIKDVDRLVAEQKADGTWDDVDYNSKLRGAWRTALHIDRYAGLAAAFHRTGNQKYLLAAKKALNYWAETMPVCPNWWYNEIGCPRSLGPATILVMKDLSQEDIDKAVKILSRASFKQTGQNKIWQAEGVMMRAYLQGDEPLMLAARDTIASEIRVDAWKEGIQPDWSFHQHGPQLQWGNYGSAYAGVMARLTVLFDGTPLAFSPEQRRVIEDYIRYGAAQPLWKGWFDMNACGRQITPGTQKKKARSIIESAKLLGVETEKYVGGRYFPYSDYGIYRTENWYASIRMESFRTIGMEQTNKENMRGRFAADGALLVRRDGDEYNDVAAAWNWHHVPGVTCHDDGKEIFGWVTPKNKRYNLSEKVFGKADGDYMVCAMELDRDGLNARKAWFFCPAGIICLGCGITFNGDERIVTGVEQCRIKGDVAQNAKFISHNGITYIPLDGALSVAPRGHSGEWYAIHPGQGKKKSAIELLDIYIDHGNAAKDAHYAYLVCPGGDSGKATLKAAKKSIKIVSNTTEKQAVSVGGKLLSIDWNKTEISF